MTASPQSSLPASVVRPLQQAMLELNDYVFSNLPADSSQHPSEFRYIQRKSRQHGIGFLLCSIRESQSSSTAVSLLRLMPSQQWHEAALFRLWSSTDVPSIVIESMASEHFSIRVAEHREPWSFSIRLGLEQSSSQPQPKCYLRASLTDGSTSGRRLIESEGPISTGLLELLRFVLRPVSTTPSSVLSELRRIFIENS